MPHKDTQSQIRLLYLGFRRTVGLDHMTVDFEVQTPVPRVHRSNAFVSNNKIVPMLLLPLPSICAPVCLSVVQVVAMFQQSHHTLFSIFKKTAFPLFKALLSWSVFEHRNVEAPCMCPVSCGHTYSHRHTHGEHNTRRRILVITVEATGHPYALHGCVYLPKLC